LKDYWRLSISIAELTWFTMGQFGQPWFIRNGSQAAMRHPSSLSTFAARTGLNE
jgi:hypothetical protein